MARDDRDPIYADIGGPRGDLARIRRLRRWISQQDAYTQSLFCEHGYYTGYKRALAYRCPDCPEK